MAGKARKLHFLVVFLRRRDFGIGWDYLESDGASVSRSCRLEQLFSRRGSGEVERGN